MDVKFPDNLVDSVLDAWSRGLRYSDVEMMNSAFALAEEIKRTLVSDDGIILKMIYI